MSEPREVIKSARVLIIGLVTVIILEWTVPSPAPFHTFETPPVVK